MIVADSGCNGHFVKNNYELQNNNFGNTINVLLPDGATIQSTNSGIIPFQGLPEEACTAHNIPDLKSNSLLSIGQLCDAECIATFDKKCVNIERHGKIILQGNRDDNGLWQVPLPNQPQANYTTILADKTATDRIAFLHAAAGYPVLST